MKIRITFNVLILVFVLGSPSWTQEDDHEHHEHETDSEAIPESIIGATASGTSQTLEVTNALPDPATKGMNDWTVTLTDNNGTLISDATLTVVPFMTVHGHGTTPSSFTAVAGEQAGTFIFTELNFIMAGTWDLTFSVTTADASDSDEIAMSISVAN